MKLYERIENNNFGEIDRNRAIELIEGGNGHLVYNENYFKLQKENEELNKKIKDKIEEYKKMLLSCNRFSDVDRIKAINERILELEELLKGEKQNV